MKFLISARIRQKLLEKHEVALYEIEECFYNRTGSFLEDTREEHQTHPPTQWFIAETDLGRLLKVVFVEDFEGEALHIKTAYEPNSTEERIYGKYS